MTRLKALTLPRPVAMSQAEFRQMRADWFNAFVVLRVLCGFWICGEMHGRKASTTKDTKVHEGKAWFDAFVVLRVLCGL